MVFACGMHFQQSCIIQPLLRTAIQRSLLGPQAPLFWKIRWFWTCFAFVFTHLQIFFGRHVQLSGSRVLPEPKHRCLPYGQFECLDFGTNPEWIGFFSKWWVFNTLCSLCQNRLEFLKLYYRGARLPFYLSYSFQRRSRLFRLYVIFDTP